MNTIPALQKNESVPENLDTITKKIQEFYEGMVTNPLQKIPAIPKIASRMKVSVNTFQMLFKLLYGCSVYQTHLEIKFAYAKQILRTGRYNLNEVSRLMGYSQPAEFVQKFKDREGKTPAQYGRKIKKQ